MASIYRKIPKDALIGGIDFNKKNLYIGRAYLDGAGIIPTEIKSGEIESDIIWGDVTKTKITEFVEVIILFLNIIIEKLFYLQVV